MTMFVSDWQWGYDGWIVVITALVAMTCAIPGSFLLVRRQSMLGDAVSHAVLPGIAIGFLVSGTRDGGWMLAGAIVAGLATAMLTQVLRRVGGVDRGAATEANHKVAAVIFRNGRTFHHVFNNRIRQNLVVDNRLDVLLF